MRLYRTAYGTNTALSLSAGTVDVGQLLYDGKLLFLRAEDPLLTCQHNHIVRESTQHVGLAG